MRRGSLGATLALLLVFAAGLAGGVAVERLWLGAASGEPVAEREAGEREAGEREDRERTVIERFSEELELTADQEARIDTILAGVRDRMHQMWSEVRPRYRAVVDSARGQIEEVLSPGQAERYRELLRREAERREERWEEKRGEEATASDTAGKEGV